MRVLQLAGVTPLPESVVNYKVAIPQTQPTSGGGFLSFLDKLSTTIQKAAPIVSTVSTTVSSVKSGGGSATINSGSAGYTPPPDPPQPGLSTAAKVAIGGTLAVLIGGGIYAATRKTKSKK